MTKYRIPIMLQSLIQDRVDIFCKKEIPNCPCRHIADARGKFIYILRFFSDDSIERVGRLTYEGDIDNMEFAIFKYSKERYCAVEFYFPGREHLDGTIEGAIKAGLAAYPVSEKTELNHSFFKAFLEFLGIER